MAQLHFTDTALLHIRAVIATSPIVEPVLSVFWWKGVVDNVRTPEGDVIWNKKEASRWYACISDWGEIPDSPERPSLEKIEGLDVYLDKLAKEAPGKFLISLTEKGLAVEHDAAQL